jgi:tetratricopeptide (TPR) repeat protein
VSTAVVLLEKKDYDAANAAAAATAKAAATKLSDFKTAFDAGAAAAGAGRQDEAIEKFTQAAASNPKCSDCYANIGNAYLQKKDYDKAEAAYKTSNEIKPNEASFTGLASVYTAQKKLDQASAAMAKATELSVASGPAGGGGNADSLFNQGVTLWNAGKIEEAKKQFQAAVAANPNHAEAHYQLGMALVNEGNLAGAAAEWDTYLKLSPTGPHAAEVNAMLPALKK